MTFIVNILHKEFSILIADKQGTLCDDCNVEIRNPDGSLQTIEVDKIFGLVNNHLAIAITGGEDCHNYLYDLSNNDDLGNALIKINHFIERPYGHPICFNNNNTSFASYFDTSAQSYCCNKFTFGNETSNELFYGGGHVARYFSAGSGSRVAHTPNLLQCISKLENISEFNLSQIRLIIEELYNEVSMLDPYVGSRFDLCYASMMTDNIWLT